MMKHITFFAIILFMLPVPLHAEKMYVDDVKATLRSGPGYNHPFLKEMSTGQIVETTDTKDGWTYVRIPNKGEGWILTRFLISEKPAECESLLSELESLHEENKTLKQENNTLKQKNNTLKQEIDETDFSIPETDEDGAACETLRKEYETLLIQAESLQEKNNTLEKENKKLSQGINVSVLNDIKACYEILKKYSADQVEKKPEPGLKNTLSWLFVNKYVYWCAGVACVFLFISGFIIGKKTNRQRRRW